MTPASIRNKNPGVDTVRTQSGFCDRRCPANEVGQL